METFDKVVQNYTNWLDNPYVSGALCIFLIAYAGMVAPRPPQIIAQFFDNTFFQVLYMFMLVFLAKRNATVALIAAIAFLVSIMALNRIKIGREMMDGSLRARSLRCSCSDELDESSAPKSETEAVVRIMQAVVSGSAEAQTEAGREKLAEVSQAKAEGVISAKQEESIRKSVIRQEAEALGHPVSERVASETITQLVQEVIQRKQEEARPMTAEGVRQMCRQVWQEYKEHKRRSEGERRSERQPEAERRSETQSEGRSEAEASCATGKCNIDVSNINNVGVRPYASDEGSHASV